MSTRFPSLAILAAACTLYGLNEMIRAKIEGLSWVDALVANWLPLSVIPISAVLVFVSDLVRFAIAQRR